LISILQTPGYLGEKIEPFFMTKGFLANHNELTQPLPTVQYHPVNYTTWSETRMQ
jgi:hypothetical protein